MSPLSWISGILALCGVLAARERATELSIVQLCVLVGMCFLAYILIRRYAIMRSSGQRLSSDSTISSGPCGFIPSAEELNDSLYELYKPLDTPPSMCVIFLHGLQSGDDRDPHLSTWKSGDGSCLWPQTWLTEKFPGAHVLSVSYSAHVGKNVQGDFDIYNIGENLLSDILQVNIGQAPFCPVILVGHCFGGFVIKQLCNHAYERFNRANHAYERFNGASDQKKVKVKLAKFLENIRGIFYYGTPHHGSLLMNKEVHHLGSNLLKYFKLLNKGGARLNDKFAESNLLTYFKLLSKEGARLNENFEQLRGLNPKCQIHGLGESLSTKSGLFQGVVGAPEASSRAGDSFNVVEADHIQICRPEKKTSRSFYGLVEVLESIATDVKKEEARAQEEETLAAEKASLQNLKYLPEHIMGIEVPIHIVETKLVESRTLGLVGMGGCGKTTLAKAIFNNLGRRFEYSAFKLDVKLISGGEDDLKEKVWSQMHHFGEQMTIKPMWSLLSGKSLLLVLDDVSSGRDLEVLFEIAKDSSPESRFLVTSRDRDLLTRLDNMYTVPFLNPIIAKKLFITYAFPEQDAPPSELESLIGAIVEKCDGLPLTLEILGKYLHKRVDNQDWEQTLIALGRADSVTGLNEKLWEKLKLSFTGLQEEEQKIFLDVATFFCGNPNCTLGEAKVAWKAAYALSDERLLWRTLVDRSLVYDVQESEIIQMHEQLRDLGRKIGAKQLKIRRVWDQEEAMGLFQSTSQWHDEEIFALRLHLSEAPKQTLTTSRRALLRFKDVRYLDVKARATIHGHQEDKVEPFLTNLIFVNLSGVHNHLTQVLFDSSILTRLVILHLSDYDGEGLPKSIGDLSALKILKLYFCSNLHSLPESFGHLSTLTNLQFRGCNELQALPESFGHLSALTVLQFYRCDELQTLPESFGHLSALTNLQFSYCQELQTLPESFGHLSALTNLQFQLCAKLQTLPDTFGQLSALQHLQFSECETFCALSSSFGQLTKLEDLKISTCLRLDILPKSFAELTALRHLSIENVALTIVPDSIRSLPSLQVLELGCLPFVKEFPPWLGEAEAGLRRMSINTFHVQDGNFALRAQRTLDEAEKERLTTGLLILALQRVRSSNLVRHCDDCGMYPLEWPRYESFTRFHYSLCPKCFQQSGSNATEYNCVECPVHRSFTCDGCEMFPLKGPRYKSSTRSDFDLCHDCFQRSGSSASEYNCFDPPILSAGDATTDILNSILALDADDRNSEIHWSSKRVQYRVFIFQERGILKRVVGDLLGALEDLNNALEIGLSHTSFDFDIRKNHGNHWYACLKHRAYVKFLLGDLDGARRDAQEALSITSENIAPALSWIHLAFAIRGYSLGEYSVTFLGFEMK